MPDNGHKLEPQNYQSGIPTFAPREPKSSLLSVPPILCKQFRNSILIYSKALWGLSVQSQVMCIFTHTSISPGPLLRQCPNHYAIHAGRNLPDKEFRYLRTVIVTAAVHWGLSSSLRLLTTPLDLPALGRRQLLYFFSRICRNLCFC